MRDDSGKYGNELGRYLRAVAALLVMSGGVLACGLAAYFFHTALYSLLGPKRTRAAVTGQRRETLAADWIDGNHLDAEFLRRGPSS